jgi:hypothetical protein
MRKDPMPLNVKTLLLAATALMATVTTANAQDANVNAPYNEFLAKYVTQVEGINLLAYDKVTDEDEAKLEAYIETLSNVDSSDFNKEEAIAYWANLYNAETINVILDNYPVKSIRKIGLLGPWKKKRLTVNGERLSLDNIEHDIVRGTYDEPRIHFAFNCASIGCPNLGMKAWEAETLDEDLDQAGRDFIATARGVNVSADGKLTGSSLFKWYKDDFGDSSEEVVAYLAQFAEGEKKDAMLAATKFDKFDYDWGLNIPE